MRAPASGETLVGLGLLVLTGLALSVAAIGDLNQWVGRALFFAFQIK